jgi:hypothetical protein
MTEAKKPESGAGPAPKNPYTVEIEVEASGPVDWASALEELESMSSTPATPAKPAPAPAAPKVDQEAERRALEGRKRYEELCRKPSMTMESDDLKIIDELSEILSYINTATNLLEKFGKAHPYLIAPNILRVWEDNLKETTTVMYREFHNLRNGRKAKTYDKRYVCTKCQSVAMLPLPEGLCDECRSKTVGGRDGSY